MRFCPEHMRNILHGPVAKAHTESLNTFKSMPATKLSPKAEDTGLRILDAALALFRQEGFDSATMRDIVRHQMIFLA